MAIMTSKNEEIIKSPKGPMLKEKLTTAAISALKQLNQKHSEEKTKISLLDESSESPVYLQVTLKKIPPKKLMRMVKVNLPHSLVIDTTEVCLITGDLEKNNQKAEIEPVVLYYKDLLKKHGVTNISEVVPLRQLRTEYKTYEARRQLCAAYDIFLTDHKIAGCLPKVLGKSFFQKRKFPIQINMDTPNLKIQIEKALSETVFSLTCRGNSCTSEVARLCMEDKEILENIVASIEILAEKIPGKWANVLGVYIKTAKSEAIPIYMSFENPNDLKLKAPRNQEKVKSEELSTVLNAEVKVFRDGRIIVKRGRPEDEEEKEDANEVQNKPKSKKVKRSKKIENETKSNADTEIDVEIEEDTQDSTAIEENLVIKESNVIMCEEEGSSNVNKGKLKNKRKNVEKIGKNNSNTTHKVNLKPTKKVKNIKNDDSMKDCSENTVHEIKRIKSNIKKDNIKDSSVSEKITEKTDLQKKSSPGLKKRLRSQNKKA